MLLSTTGNIDGKQIKEYKGVVFGEVINGANFFKDFSASITNIVGGRAEVYEKEIVDARNSAINEMIYRANNMGANAIIGMRVDVETLNGSMMMVTASGTAVII